jgi:hypothetical protein
MAVTIYLPTVSRTVKSCGSVALLARIVSYPDRVVTPFRRFSLGQKRREGQGDLKKIEQFPPETTS